MSPKTSPLKCGCERGVWLCGEARWLAEQADLAYRRNRDYEQERDYLVRLEEYEAHFEERE